MASADAATVEVQSDARAETLDYSPGVDAGEEEEIGEGGDGVTEVCLFVLCLLHGCMWELKLMMNTGCTRVCTRHVRSCD